MEFQWRHHVLQGLLTSLRSAKRADLLNVVSAHHKLTRFTRARQILSLSWENLIVAESVGSMDFEQKIPVGLE